MYICVDFDGTIVDHTFPSVGQPVPGAIEWMKTFIELGGKIILFTMRSDGKMQSGEVRSVLSEAIWYLKGNGIELFGVNRNPTQDEWTTNPKAYGHVYIDDAAAGCPMIHPEGFNRPCVDWSKIGPEIKARILELKA